MAGRTFVFSFTESAQRPTADASKATDTWLPICMMDPMTGIYQLLGTSKLGGGIIDSSCHVSYINRNFRINIFDQANVIPMTVGYKYCIYAWGITFE